MIKVRKGGRSDVPLTHARHRASPGDRRCAAWRDRTCRRYARPAPGRRPAASIDDFPRPFRTQFRALREKLVGTAREVAGQIDRGCGGLGISERDHFFPAFVFWTTCSRVRRASDCGIGDLGREERHRLRPAQPPGENKIRQPEPQESAAELSFVTAAAVCAAARTGLPSSRSVSAKMSVRGTEGLRPKHSAAR